MLMLRNSKTKYAVLHCLKVKVKSKANIRNRYNQVPHLTRDTILESDKKTSQTREPRGQP